MENVSQSGSGNTTKAVHDAHREALAARDYGALGSDWRTVTFWCRECNRCYCTNHWRGQFPRDDPMASDFGICPEGHGKILDD